MLNNSYRTAADWVAIRAGLDPLPPLPASFFVEEGEGSSSSSSSYGGLVVVGSYVPKSSEQLQRLREAGGIEVGGMGWGGGGCFVLGGGGERNG